MLITKNKSKSNDEVYVNFIIGEDLIKSTKNPKFKKISVKATYKVGLSDKETIEIGNLNFKTMKIVK